MAFLDGTTSVVDAILTRKGRELLSKNDGSFKITKFAFGDDDINYGLYDATNPDNPDANILNLPVLEPISNEDVAQRYRLITMPKGSLKISVLSINPTNITVAFGDTASFVVKTTNGNDVQGYYAKSRDEDIAVLENSKVVPNSAGEATFNIYTGINAGSKSGLVVLDVTGLNTGARSTVSLTVSASGV